MNFKLFSLVLMAAPLVACGDQSSFQMPNAMELAAVYSSYRVQEVGYHQLTDILCFEVGDNVNVHAIPF